jgi:putative peptidoglycan lipid II flippase
VQLLLSVPLVELSTPRNVVPALALASTIGQLTVAFPMVAVIRKMRNPAALAGVGHAALAGIAAAAAASAAGLAVTLLVPAGGGKVFDAGSGVLSAAVAVVVFGAVAYALDRGDLRNAAARLHRVVKRYRAVRSARAVRDDG